MSLLQEEQEKPNPFLNALRDKVNQEKIPYFFGDTSFGATNRNLCSATITTATFGEVEVKTL